jgi:hypothetical protein
LPRPSTPPWATTTPPFIVLRPRGVVDGAQLTPALLQGVRLRGDLRQVLLHARVEIGDARLQLVDLAAQLSDLLFLVREAGLQLLHHAVEARDVDVARLQMRLQRLDALAQLGDARERLARARGRELLLGAEVAHAHHLGGVDGDGVQAVLDRRHVLDGPVVAGFRRGLLAPCIGQHRDIAAGLLDERDAQDEQGNAQDRQDHGGSAHDGISVGVAAVSLDSFEWGGLTIEVQVTETRSGRMS